MGAEEPHQTQPLGDRDTALRDREGVVEAVRRVQHPLAVRVDPADVVDEVELLGDPQRDVEVGKRRLDLAGDPAVHRTRVQGMALDVAGSDQPGHRQRSVGDLARLLEPGAEHQDLGESGKCSRGGCRGRIGRDVVHGGLVRALGELALAGDPGVATQPLVQQRRPGRVGVSIDEPDRLLDRGDGAVRVLEAGDACQPPQDLDPVLAETRLGVGDLVPELDRALVLVLRLRERIARLGVLGGGHRCGQRTRQVVGRVPVIRELRGVGHPRGRARLEGPGERGMEPSPLPGEEIVVDRLLEQRVAEGIALDVRGRVEHEDLPGDALAERLVEPRVVETRRFGDEGRIDAPAGRGRDPEDLLRRLTQVGDVCEKHIAEGLGQLDRAVLARRGEQLLGEERVAARPAMDRVEERRAQVVTGDRPQLVGDLHRVERQQRDPLHAADSLQLGEERQQGMPPVELVRAVAEHQGHPRVPQVPDQEAEEVARRAVRPVKILDDEDDRRRGGEPLERAEDQLEQAALGRLDAEAALRVDRRPSEIGDEPRELRPVRPEDRFDLVGVGAADEAAQRLDYRCVRDRAVGHVDAPADEDRRAAPAGVVREVLDQAGLADAGFAGDQDRIALAVLGEPKCPNELVQLTDAADQNRAGDA